MERGIRKYNLCRRHNDLIFLLWRYGNNSMLLTQLRALCLDFGYYTNDAAVNRAVRDLKAADVLGSIPAFTGNGDMVMGRKYFLRYIYGVDSQGIASPPKPSTRRPYVMRARRIAWLQDLIQREGLHTEYDVRRRLKGHACTMFMPMSEIPEYYKKIFARLNADCWQAELDAVQRILDQRQTMSVTKQARPMMTLLTQLQRGVYITDIVPCERVVKLTLFPTKAMQAQKIMTRILDAARWIRCLLHYSVEVTLEALNERHANLLYNQLHAPTGREGIEYWESRVLRERLQGTITVPVHDSGFTSRWCGGREASDF